MSNSEKEQQSETTAELIRRIRALETSVAGYRNLEKTLKGKEAKLTESERRLRALFEQKAIGVAQIISNTGQFVIINERYCDIVGYSQEEMESLTFQQITHPDDVQEDLDNMELLISGEIREYSMEKRYFHKNGSVIWVNLTVSPMWKEGENPDFHIAVVEDITERKQARDSLNIKVKERTEELESVLTLLKKEIDERKETELSLKKSEEQYRIMMEQSPVGIFIADRQGNHLDVNREACKMLGYTRDELLSLHMKDLLFEEDLEKHPLRMPDLFEGKTVVSERRLKRKDGSSLSADLSARMLPDGRLQGIAHDISERKKADAFIHVQRDMGLALSGATSMKEALTILLDLAVMIDDMDCGGIYLLDRKSGSLEMICSKGLSDDFVRKALHYDKGSDNVRLVLSGKPMYVDYSELPVAKTDPENREGLASIAIIPVIHHNRVVACMNIASHTSGHISSIARSSQETIASQVGSAITRLLTEEALKKAKEEIEAWNRELEKRVSDKTEELKKSQAQLIQSEKLSAMGQMAGGLAHELNSPLAGLLPMLEHYRNEAEPGSEKQKELSLMYQACDYMAKIVRDFSSFSRESKGEITDLIINDVIEDTLNLTLSRIKQKSIRIIRAYHDHLPVLKGEKTELQQVILNIITNALDAMADRGELRIKTDVTNDHEMVVMEFSDNGPGIEKEYVDMIFDPFYTTKRPGKGTGLGLSVTYKIVEKHNGHITVDSVPGQGAKFTVLLPIELNTH